jgi:DNA-binding XRE family transcriptional regulator
MITALQSKMARACLDWPIRTLSERVGVNQNTIIRFEAGGDPRASIRDKIEAVFVEEGFAFPLDGFTVTSPAHLKPIYKPISYKRAA